MSCRSNPISKVGRASKQHCNEMGGEASNLGSSLCNVSKKSFDVPVSGRELSVDVMHRLKYYLHTAGALVATNTPVVLSNQDFRATVSLDELISIASDLLRSLESLARPQHGFGMSEPPKCRPEGRKALLGSLTPMQARVLALIAAGKMNKQIAWELGLSEQTVKGHVSTILKRLGARTRTHAASLAAAHLFASS